MRDKRFNPKNITLTFEDANFECMRCGRCCFGPTRYYGIKMFYQEVRAIQNYIKKMPQADLKEFAWDYCTSMGAVGLIGHEEFFSEFKGAIENFFSSVSNKFSDKEKGFFVEYYVLKTMQDSNRCIFFNPMDNSCFIHKVRPMVCRLYPFYSEIDLEKGSIDVKCHRDEECPGLTSKTQSDNIALGKDGMDFAAIIYNHYATLSELLEPIDKEKSEYFREFYTDTLKYRLATETETKERYEKMKNGNLKFMKNKSTIRDLFAEANLIEFSRRS
jgi:Fe-S-cluster containining protein